MCVAISMLPGASLKEEEVAKMDRANADGAGIAWVKDGMVHWYKTVKVSPGHITRIINHHLGSPRLVHFRLATAGGRKEELCHPFEIGPLASCKAVGKASKVLIHNGHWSRWDDVLRLLGKEGLLPDAGPWSDTRLASYLAYHDMDWLEVLGGRVAVMDGKGQLTHHGDWKDYREGIKVSNMGWDVENGYRRGGYGGYDDWRGWGWTENDWNNYKDKLEEARKKRMEDWEKEKAKEQQRLLKSGQDDDEDGKGCPAVFDTKQLLKEHEAENDQLAQEGEGTVYGKETKNYTPKHGRVGFQGPGQHRGGGGQKSGSTTGGGWAGQSRTSDEPKTNESRGYGSAQPSSLKQIAEIGKTHETGEEPWYDWEHAESQGENPGPGDKPINSGELGGASYPFGIEDSCPPGLQDSNAYGDNLPNQARVKPKYRVTTAGRLFKVSEDGNMVEITESCATAEPVKGAKGDVRSASDRHRDYDQGGEG